MQGQLPLLRVLSSLPFNKAVQQDSPKGWECCLADSSKWNLNECQKNTFWCYLNDDPEFQVTTEALKTWLKGPKREGWIPPESEKNNHKTTDILKVFNLPPKIAS